MRVGKGVCWRRLGTDIPTDIYVKKEDSNRRNWQMDRRTFNFIRLSVYMPDKTMNLCHKLVCNRTKGIILNFYKFHEPIEPIEE